ncbi:hypothetical protein FRC18_002172 [Serendipita sp. 400]|nr:hypothetical protein FRC18_002172 [Serendipita sp. 400]
MPSVVANDVFIIKGKSMLDAVFIRRARLDLRRPEYITTTLDSTTVLWRVSHRGYLHRLAEFCWESSVSTSQERSKRDGMVIRRDGVDHPAEFYGRRRSPSSRYDRSSLLKLPSILAQRLILHL